MTGEGKGEETPAEREGVKVVSLRFQDGTEWRGMKELRILRRGEAANALEDMLTNNSPITETEAKDASRIHADSTPLRKAIAALSRRAAHATAARWHEERKKLQEDALFTFGLDAMRVVYAALKYAWAHRFDAPALAANLALVDKFDFNARKILAADPALFEREIEKIRSDRDFFTEEAWSPIPQERVSNELTKPNCYLPLVQEKSSGIDRWAETIHNHLCLKADNAATLSPAILTPATFQFLDFLLLKAHKINNFASFSVSVSEYMEARGLKDRKAAKEQIKRAISTLFNIRITYDSRSLSKAEKKNIPKGFPLDIEFRILDAKSTLNARGDMAISFSKVFSPLIASAPPMAYHAALLKLNTHTNPNSHAFGRKLLEVFNMSIERKRVEIEAGRYEVILGVDTLLAIAQLKDDPAHFTQCIKEPFERDLSALSDMGTWGYCHEKGEPLHAGEEVNDYAFFKSLYIRFTFHDYPQQTRRLQHFAEKMEEKRKREAAKLAKVEADKKKGGKV